MPRDDSGAYTLPTVYEAVAGTTIMPVQHNAPLEDIAEALTGSLPRNGTAAMTGPLRLPDGTLAAPAMGFTGQGGVGIVRVDDGLAIVVGGQIVARFTAGGFTAIPVGTPVPVLVDTLPARHVWAAGQNVSRAAYPALFALFGTKFGAGDGVTTFGVPDLRGRGLFGRDNIGGTDAGRLSDITFDGSGTRLVSGSTGGAGTVALTVAQMPAHSHPDSTANSAGAHTHTTPDGAGSQIAPVGPGAIFSLYSPSTTGSGGAHTHTLNIASQGGGAAHNNLPPAMLVNWAIFAGA